jgi:hypothetical protein
VYFLALATDYDGTLASEGQVSPVTVTWGVGSEPSCIGISRRTADAHSGMALPIKVRP